MDTGNKPSYNVSVEIRYPLENRKILKLQYNSWNHINIKGKTGSGTHLTHKPVLYYQSCD